jgi:formyl-CoA transferase
VRKLAEQCDVVVENFKVGGLKKFGLDAESLRAANPRLIVASITGFGQDGPYAERAGYDFIIQGMGGMMSITGLPDDQPGGGPLRVGVAVVDLFTGMYTASAILAALFRRERAGDGAHIDAALFDTPARGARKPGFQCARVREGPAAAGQYAPEHRAVPAVRSGR